ncbi:MAG: RAMP superfamily CRISPR-associated protein [Planctomycetota bacterium]|nr:RAMP superfamily CRISPR-associated protein [Planctomycetota bacterium]
MPKFHNPYHFVPMPAGQGDQPPAVARREFEGQTAAHLTHDRYVSQLFSGRLVCQLQTKDPVIIGAAQEAGDKSSNTSRQVTPFQLPNRSATDAGEAEKLPAIPASTLRGLISSVTEAATCSAMRVLADTRLSRRMAMGKGTRRESLSAIGMIVIEKDENGTETRRLRPLALPSLQYDVAQGRSILKDEQAAVWKMFSDCRTALRVYVDVEPDSYGADNRNEFWYLKLPPQDAIRVTADKSGIEVQDVGGAGDRGRELSCPFAKIKVTGPTHQLLAQQPVGNRNPLSRDKLELPSPEANPADHGYTRGILRVLGIFDGRASEMPTKKHEIFLPYTERDEQRPTFAITDGAWDTFRALADQQASLNKENTKPGDQLPFHTKGSQRAEKTKIKRIEHPLRLRDGDLVFFQAGDGDDGEPVVDELAVSSIWRKDSGPVHAYFEGLSPELLPFNTQRKTITVAEQMFGFVEEVKKELTAKSAAGSAKKPPPLAFKSRLRFSFGHAAPSQSDLLLPEVPLRPLLSPKPPCPAMYFTRRSGSQKLITKQELKPPHNKTQGKQDDQDYIPQGRKFYLHRHDAGQPLPPNAEPWRADDQARPDLSAIATPIAANKTFWFHVDFHNLTRHELSALCYALSPADQWLEAGDYPPQLLADGARPKFWHKLGMGKPLGLGAVEIKPLGLFYVDREQRYRELTWDKSAPRYRCVRFHAGGDAGLLPAWYEQERATQESGADGHYASFGELRAEFRGSMNRTVRRALELIGNPASITALVQPPRDEQAEPAKAQYEWFVRNKKQCLPPVTAESEQLPKLDTRH